MPSNACQVHKLPKDETALLEPKATGSIKNIKNRNVQDTKHLKEKASADIQHQSKVISSYEPSQLVLMI